MNRILLTLNRKLGVLLKTSKNLTAAEAWPSFQTSNGNAASIYVLFSLNLHH